MNIQNNTYNKTATQNEQQFKTKKSILGSIIKILPDSNSTITDSKDMTFKTIIRYIYEKYIVFLYCNMHILSKIKQQNNPHNINKSMVGSDIQYHPASVNKTNIALGIVPKHQTN